MISSQLAGTAVSGSSSGRATVVALGVSLCTPTLVFFFASVLDRNDVYIQAGSVTVFLWPLSLLAAHFAASEAQVRRALLLIVLCTAPLWFSIVLHLPLYVFEHLGTAVSRTVSLTIYLLTMALLSGHPRGADILRDSFRLMAVILAALALFGALAMPEWHYRRFDPANLHPNWWGEVCVAIVFGASFFKRSSLRYLFWIGALVLCILVQNRSAIGHILLIIGFATLAHEGIKRLTLIWFLAMFVAMPVLLLLDRLALNGAIFGPLIDWLLKSVFLLNDPRRGLSTGFTGRDAGWLYALHVITENPWTGIGFSRANALRDAQTTELIHNGHLVLLADLGLVGYVILASFIFGALFMEGRRGNFIVFGFLAGFALFNIMLIPRAINMSVLPMLFWMLVMLAWLPPRRSEQEGQDTAGSVGHRRHGATGIGARWVSALPVAAGEGQRSPAGAPHRPVTSIARAASRLPRKV